MSYPTHEEIKEFISNYGQTDEDLCVVLGIDPEEDCSEMGVNCGYVWSFGYNCWFNKNGNYTAKEEQILDLFKNDNNFKLPNRIVTITATRYYSKQTTIEVEVDDAMVDEDLHEYLTNDEIIDNQIEDGLGDASLVGEDTKYEFQDPTNHYGGHL